MFVETSRRRLTGLEQQREGERRGGSAAGSPGALLSPWPQAPAPGSATSPTSLGRGRARAKEK